MPLLFIFIIIQLPSPLKGVVQSHGASIQVSVAERGTIGTISSRSMSKGTESISKTPFISSHRKLGLVLILNVMDLKKNVKVYRSDLERIGPSIISEVFGITRSKGALLSWVPLTPKIIVVVRPLTKKQADELEVSESGNPYRVQPQNTFQNQTQS